MGIKLNEIDVITVSGKIDDKKDGGKYGIFNYEDSNGFVKTQFINDKSDEMADILASIPRGIKAKLVTSLEIIDNDSNYDD